MFTGKEGSWGIGFPRSSKIKQFYFIIKEKRKNVLNVLFILTKQDIVHGFDPFTFQAREYWLLMD